MKVMIGTVVCLVASVTLTVCSVGTAVAASLPNWSTARLSEPRSELAAASAAGKVLFAGGYSTSGPSSVVDIYDTASGQWTATYLPHVQGRLVGTSAAGKVFFGGGYQYAVDVYDAAGGIWTTTSFSLSRSRDFLSATSASGKVFFAGGFDYFAGVSPVVDIYDTVSGTQTVAGLSQAREDLAATSSGNKVFFAGGFNGSGFSDVVDIYDVASGVWSTAILSEARRSLVAASAGGKVYFAGGYSSNGFSSVVDIFDTATGLWSTARLWERREYLSAASSGSRVFFGGGVCVGGGEQFDSRAVDFFDAASACQSMTWLSQGRFRLAAASADGKVLFGGGSQAGGLTDLVDIYDANAPWVQAEAGGPYLIDPGQTISLDGTQSGGSAPIVSWLWDIDSDGAFGDLTGATPSISYDYLTGVLQLCEGSHLIGLRVSLADGTSDTTYTSLNVGAVPEPATLSLLTVGGLALLRRSRRK